MAALECVETNVDYRMNRNQAPVQNPDQYQ